ncbi:MAG: hypothetical protein AABX75_01740, partial [Nanoarchaeota archaeon]
MATAAQSSPQQQQQPPPNVAMAGTLEDSVGLAFATTMAERIAKEVFPRKTFKVERVGLEVIAKEASFFSRRTLVSISLREPYKYNAHVHGADAGAISAANRAILKHQRDSYSGSEYWQYGI